jgi:NADH-quinone oxidoreductase subunit K
MTITLEHALVVAIALFAVGAAGATTRRNVLIVFMSIELMLAAAALAVLAFARASLLPEGGTIALFLLVVMAAEASVGLAIAVACFRRNGTIRVDELRLLRG